MLNFPILRDLFPFSTFYCTNKGKMFKKLLILKRSTLLDVMQIRFRDLLLNVTLHMRFHKPAHKLVRCYLNAPRPKIHFPEQLAQCHRKGNGFRCCSSSSTRQAITNTSACYPPQCIFLLLSYRTFNSDTNTFSTSYARSIPFTNCAGGRQFFSPRRHNSREGNIRS